MSLQCAERDPVVVWYHFFSDVETSILASLTLLRSVCNLKIR